MGRGHLYWWWGGGGNIQGVGKPKVSSRVNHALLEYNTTSRLFQMRVHVDSYLPTWFAVGSSEAVRTVTGVTRHSIDARATVKTGIRVACLAAWKNKEKWQGVNHWLCDAQNFLLVGVGAHIWCARDACVHQSSAPICCILTSQGLAWSLSWKISFSGEIKIKMMRMCVGSAAHHWAFRNKLAGWNTLCLCVCVCFSTVKVQSSMTQTMPA